MQKVNQDAVVGVDGEGLVVGVRPGAALRGRDATHSNPSFQESKAAEMIFGRTKKGQTDDPEGFARDGNCGVDGKMLFVGDEVGEVPELAGAPALQVRGRCRPHLKPKPHSQPDSPARLSPIGTASVALGRVSPSKKHEQ